MYKVNIEGNSFEIDKQELNQLNSINTGNSTYHVLENGKAYHIKLIHADYLNKKLTLSVNGNPHTIQIEDQYDQLVKRMGLSAVSSQKIKEVKAPMPGLILDVLVEAGTSVEKGTPLVILEAMKMENVLKAEGEGIVERIEATKGNAVEKGQVLLIME